MKRNKLTKFVLIALIGCGWSIFSSGQTNLTIETAIKIEFPTFSTNAYMLEQSTNLVDWVDSWQSWSAGSGWPITRFYEIENPGLFYRVQSTPRPDVVAGTIPENGNMDVDAAITNLTVYFSSGMQTNGAMHVRSDTTRVKGEFPLMPGPQDRSWVDDRTYTMAIALESNTLYYAEFTFTTAEGIPSLMYPVTFKTQ
jgi:hypothetical protein